jgi:hypothetical protein
LNILYLNHCQLFINNTLGFTPEDVVNWGNYLQDFENGEFVLQRKQTKKTKEGSILISYPTIEHKEHNVYFSNSLQSMCED